MNEAEEKVGSVEDAIAVGVVVGVLLLALFFGFFGLLILGGVILVLFPGLLVIGKMIDFIKNIVSGVGKFLTRVANFVTGKKQTTTNGSGWGVQNGAIDTSFTAGGNITGDPTLTAVNAITVSNQASIGEIGAGINGANYTASFPLGDPFQGPSYLVFGPLDEVKYTPFWVPDPDVSAATNASEEQKYLSLCPYSNPLYKDPNGLAGNSEANPLKVIYDNTKNTPKYNYYGYVDSDTSNGIGSSFGNITNGSFFLDDELVPYKTVNASPNADVGNAGAVRLSSNNAVWIKDMRTGELRLVPFQTLNGQLRTSTATTSLNYSYTETTETSGHDVVKNQYGNTRWLTTTATEPVTTTNATAPVTPITVTRLYEATSNWVVQTGGTADVSAVLNLGFGLSPMEGYVLAKRTGLLINQDKIYANPQATVQDFTVSGVSTDPSIAKTFKYYQESPGAGLVIFNLRSTGSDTLTLKADKQAYYAQENSMSMEQFNATWKADISNQGIKKAYAAFWANIAKPGATQPDFMIKDTNEQFIVSMEYKPFTSDMLNYWASKMPGFAPVTTGGINSVSFLEDKGAWQIVGGSQTKALTVVSKADDGTPLESGTTSSFSFKTATGAKVTAQSFKDLANFIDTQGFNKRLGVKGDTSADPLGTGKIYADPFKGTPASFISRFSTFNPFTAFDVNILKPNKTISTPLFAFESGVETYVGVSAAQYTQIATYKTTGSQPGYIIPATGLRGTIPVKAGDSVKDLYTGKPTTEVVTLPAIKLPWGPNPISSAEVVLPPAGFDLSIGQEAKTFYGKLEGLIKANVNNVLSTSNLSYLPLMDKSDGSATKDRTTIPLYVEGTKDFFLTEFKKNTSSGAWEITGTMVKPSQEKKNNPNYEYIVTPKLPDDFAIFTKYISYSEGVAFNKTALDNPTTGATTGSKVTNALTPASTSYESDFSYTVAPTGALPDKNQINQTDPLLAKLYVIKQGDMKPDGTLTPEALGRIKDPTNYISSSQVGTFAIVDPSNYYQAPQEDIIDINSDNIVNFQVPSDIPPGIDPNLQGATVTPPSATDLSVFKGFPQGSPLGSLSTCVTALFGKSGDYTSATGVSFHAGVDLSTGGVSQPIYSTLNGVIRTGTTVNGGNVIEIWSSYLGADGQTYYVRVRFCHTAYSVLQDGAEVKPGDLVGYSGNSGTPYGGMGVSSYAYHLHYEIRISPKYADLNNSLISAVNPLDPKFEINVPRICL